MICPHCGKEIVTPVYTEPANTAGQPALTLLPNITAVQCNPYPIITNGNGQIPWINTVCAAGAAVAPPVTFHYTVGDNDKR